ncbi:MAG: heme/copper-type cytochrome/quinol oxidase subunit 2, partial [Paracoccaceae bacterium]
MFQNLTDTLTHRATLPVIGILLLIFLVFLTLSAVSPDTKPRKRQFSDNPMMNALGWFGAILALPGLAILFAAGWELIVLAWNYPSLDKDASEIRWHSSIMLAMLAAIGAIFTLVFAYVR